MRQVSRDLAKAPTKMRSGMRRNVAAAVKPMQLQVQRNAFSIPVRGPRSTGLRVALMRATRIQINGGARMVAVTLMTDGRRMPAGQQTLPRLMEGEKKWRHPVYGPHDSTTWVAQQSHPYFAPAVPPYLPGVAAGVDAALQATAEALARGGL